MHAGNRPLLKHGTCYVYQIVLHAGNWLFHQMLISRVACRKLVILWNLSQYAEKQSFFIKKFNQDWSIMRIPVVIWFWPTLYFESINNLICWVSVLSINYLLYFHCINIQVSQRNLHHGKIRHEYVMCINKLCDGVKLVCTC